MASRGVSKLLVRLVRFVLRCLLQWHPHTITRVLKQDMESFRRRRAYSQQFVVSKEKMRGVLPCVTGQ